MEKPWYILEFEEKEYLHNRKLFKKDIDFEKGDHRHCEICWDRLSCSKSDLNCGYYEEKSQSWICEECFNNFKSLFKWSVE